MLQDLRLPRPALRVVHINIFACAVKNRFFSAFIISIALIISACSVDNNSNEKNSDKKYTSSFLMPNALQVTALPLNCIDSLQANLIIDGNDQSPIAMIITADNKASYEITSLSPGPHQFLIEFKCQTTAMLMLANASISHDIVDGPNVIQFVNSDYLPLPDIDDDNVSNLSELINGSDPFTAPEIPDITPPSAPNMLRASNITVNSIELSWLPATDAESLIVNYKIYRDNVFKAESATSPFLDQGLTAATLYRYRVSAINGAAIEGPQTANIDVTTDRVIDTTAPTIPGPARGSNISAESIQLDWNLATDTESGVALYKIYRDNIDIATVNAPPFVDSELTESTTYSYQISAINGESLESTRSEARLFTTLTPIVPIDTTPPTAPGTPTAGDTTTQSIEVTWTAATDNESDIVEYRLYRDSVLITTITTVNTLSYLDTGLSPSTSYVYYVIAVNSVNLAGPQSSESTLSTRSESETTPPELLSVTTGALTTEVSIVFSEAVELLDATAITNYQISPAITISAASLSTDLSTVTLSTSPMNVDTPYTLTVSNIKDLATPANTILPNSNRTFTYLISGTSRANYQWDILAGNSVVYTDEAFDYDVIPVELIGINYLRTVNADRTSLDEPFLTFTVSHPVVIYIGYDVNSPPPSWLNIGLPDIGWLNTGLIATIESPTNISSNLQIYSRSFPAGLITLDNQGDAQNMYTVYLKPDSIAALSTALTNSVNPRSLQSTEPATLIVIGVP